MEETIKAYNQEGNWVAINALDIKGRVDPLPLEVVVEPKPSEWNPDMLEMPRGGIYAAYFKDLMNGRTIVIKNRENDWLNELIPNNADFEDLTLTFKFEKFDDPNEPNNRGANVSNLFSNQTFYPSSNIKLEGIENLANINGIFSNAKFIDCSDKIKEYLEPFKDLGNYPQISNAFNVISFEPYELPKFNYDNFIDDYYGQWQFEQFPWWNVSNSISLYNKLFDQIFSSDKDFYYGNLLAQPYIQGTTHNMQSCPETSRTNPLVIDTKDKPIQYLQIVPCCGAYVSFTTNINNINNWGNEIGRANSYWTEDGQLYIPCNKYTKVRFTADYYNNSWLNIYIDGHWCGNAVNDFLMNLPDTTKPEFNNMMNPTITLGYSSYETPFYTNNAITDEAMSVAIERGWTINNNLVVGEFD